MKVYSKIKEEKLLGQELARGGEGAVYPLRDRPEVLVKVYHPEVMQKRGGSIEKKVQAMIPLKGRVPDSVSWPSIPVFDASQRWIGYAMRKAQGIPMAKMAHAMLYSKYFPGLDRRAIVDYLCQMIDTIEALHREQVFIGDFNLNNILCLPGSNRVSLIDCDSYQVSVNGELFACPVGSPDMTPPEQHGQDFSRLKRTDASECFSVAIVIFKCLMLGRHPYDAVGGDDPVKNILAGHFPYGKGSRGIPVGPWYNIWSHMPFRLKDLFIGNFTEGSKDPSSRVKLGQWKEALQIYKNEMEKGWHEVAVKPQKPKEKEYRGQKSAP